MKRTSHSRTSKVAYAGVLLAAGMVLGAAAEAVLSGGMESEQRGSKDFQPVANVLEGKSCSDRRNVIMYWAGKVDKAGFFSNPVRLCTIFGDFVIERAWFLKRGVRAVKSDGDSIMIPYSSMVDVQVA